MDLTTLVDINENYAQIDDSGIQFVKNYPNPFRSETKITFALTKKSHVSIEVFDLNGAKVVNLMNNTLNKGDHSVVWNGCDRSGIRLPEGSYICKIAADNFSDTKKMMLLGQ